jgi:hypothetical protein
MHHGLQQAAARLSQAIPLSSSINELLSRPDLGELWPRRTA